MCWSRIINGAFTHLISGVRRFYLKINIDIPYCFFFSIFSIYNFIKLCGFSDLYFVDHSQILLPTFAFSINSGLTMQMIKALDIMMMTSSQSNMSKSECIIFYLPNLFYYLFLHLLIYVHSSLYLLNIFFVSGSIAECILKKMVDKVSSLRMFTQN